ncbi:hypothetical protein PIB30_031633 [Stylosanthes scabra]|uniref:Uncharacterized protein n=1 Tax=Stylosanthes scabra TaxID=79078 RepID=A0ABU6WC60_9FABA|nr:hypothetical protein [Stylosanthes scabra]
MPKISTIANLQQAAGGDGNAYGGSGRRRRGALDELALESDVFVMEKVPLEFGL